MLPDLDDIDYCILLGNLLDNAIEAERSRNILNPEIQVQIRVFENRICISIRNRIQQSVLGSNPDLTSTKQDAAPHGFGIRTIREIVNKHHGTAAFYEEKNWFVADLELIAAPAAEKTS